MKQIEKVIKREPQKHSQATDKVRILSTMMTREVRKTDLHLILKQKKMSIFAKIKLYCTVHFASGVDE